MCQKALDGYLEQKRSMFPRFYFVSNPVLLQMLSQGSDPKMIQPFYQTVFDAIDHVVHDQKNQRNITAMVSLFKGTTEEIPFLQPVVAKGNIEESSSSTICGLRASATERSNTFARRTGRNPRTGHISARHGPSSETKPLVAARWVGSTRVRFLAKKTIGRSKATSPPKPVPQPQPTTTRRHSTSEACDSLGSSGMGDALRIGGRLIDDRCRIHALRQCRAEVRSTRSAA